MVKAFEKEVRSSVPWHSDRWTILRAFQHDVENETKHARAKFQFPGCHLENDEHSRSYWLSVINEEIGKLAQCANKLQLAKDPQVIAEWEAEGYHRIVTASSLLRRLAERWQDLPNG